MAPEDKGKTVFMFPGQGAQQPKMGLDLWQKYDRAKRLFSMASEIYGENLEEICFHRPFREMQRTDHAQILIGTVSLVVHELLREEGVVPDIVLGHSAGEMVALYASGAVDLESVFRLISVRGRSMYQAALQKKGKMVAVLDLSPEEVECLVERHRSHGTISICNYNAPTESVVTGDFDAVTQLERYIRENRIGRVTDLEQQGAWHSEHMKPAQEIFAAAMAQTKIASPKVPMIFNHTAEYAQEPDEIRDRLVRILTTPVRWHGCLRRVAQTSPKIFCEVGPHKILRGLLRKSYRQIGCEGYDVFSLGDVASLNAFVEKIGSKKIG